MYWTKCWRNGHGPASCNSNGGGEVGRHIPDHTMKAYRGRRSTALLILNLSTNGRQWFCRIEKSLAPTKTWTLDIPAGSITVLTKLSWLPIFLKGLRKIIKHQLQELVAKPRLKPVMSRSVPLIQTCDVPKCASHSNLWCPEVCLSFKPVMSRSVPLIQTCDVPKCASHSTTMFS